MAAHSGKGSANGSGANPALDADAADELAANFRPSWAADDDDDLPPGMQPPAAPAGAPAPGAQPAVSVSPVVTISGDPRTATSTVEAAAAANAAAAVAPAPAPPQTQKMLSPQTVLGMGSPVRSPEPSSEALDSQNVIEVAPAKSLSNTLPMNSAPMRAPASGQSALAQGFHAPPSGGPASAKPVTRNVARPAGAVDPFKASAIDSDEFPVLKKSNKGLIFGVVGVGIAVGLGLFLKFALSPDEPAKATTTPATTTATAKENDIPPPPPKEETPPPATATATPPPTVAKADPPPAEPPPKKDPPPVQKAPDPPRTVAAAPAKAPKQPPASPPAAAPPKTPPKSAGGGIVRDSPF